MMIILRALCRLGLEILRLRTKQNIFACAWPYRMFNRRSRTWQLWCVKFSYNEAGFYAFNYRL